MTATWCSPEKNTSCCCNEAAAAAAEKVPHVQRRSCRVDCAVLAVLAVLGRYIAGVLAGVMPPVITHNKS